MSQGLLIPLFAEAGIVFTSAPLLLSTRIPPGECVANLPLIEGKKAHNTKPFCNMTRPVSRPVTFLSVDRKNTVAVFGGAIGAPWLGVYLMIVVPVPWRFLLLLK